MIVYRVQDTGGRGPWKPGFSQEWSDEVFAPGQKAMPTIIREFGADIFVRLGKPGEYFGSAVERPKDLLKWFSATERKKLEALGYIVASMKADRILAKSKNQILFARYKPLNSGIFIITWDDYEKTCLRY